MRLVLASMAFVPATSVEAYLYREVRDWAVSCDNGLTCELQIGVDAGDIRALSFVRTSEAGAPMTMMLGLGVDGMPESRTVTFSVDGEERVSVMGDDGVAHGYASRLAFPDFDARGPLLEAMKEGTRLTVAVSGEEMFREADVSLSGVTAGLILIDEAQGRVDRRDALQAVGEKEPRERPLARSISRITDMPDAVRAEFASMDDYCGGVGDDRFALIGAVAIPMPEEGVELIAAPCGMGGAYNQPYTLYRGIGGRFRAVEFPVMGEEGPTSEPMAYNLDFDAQAREISSFFKGRGIGDCGAYQRWRIDAGAQLVLIEARVKSDCDGDHAGGVEMWPLVWPAE